MVQPWNAPGLRSPALGFSLQPGMWQLPWKGRGNGVVPVQTAGIGLG